MDQHLNFSGKMLNFLEEDIENTFNIGFIAYAPKVQATRKKRGDKLDFTKTIFFLQ